MTSTPRSPHSQAWKWWVCGLLFLASTINYMDRQTLGNLSGEVKDHFKLGNKRYGELENVFGLAFAVGSLLFGFIADRTKVRWLYPAVLLLWSAVGFTTGLVQTFAQLWLCRLFLGLFEAGHWPCALRTTQRLLSPQERSLGNSVLQGGTAIGAIVTPQIINLMVSRQLPESWRGPFMVLGALGSLWAIAWVFSIPSDMDSRRVEFADAVAGGCGNGPAIEGDSFWSAVFGRRFLVLAIVVICINGCWHFFRVWLIRYLDEQLHYTRDDARNVVTMFNIATEIGCLGAGVATVLLRRAGATVHGARAYVFGAAALLTASSLLLPLFAKGTALVALLMVIGAGALAMFPCFYSMTQELSGRHQGKIGGLLGAIAWITSSPVHPYFGGIVDKTGRFDVGMQIAGVVPLIAVAAIVLGWRSQETTTAQAR